MKSIIYTLILTIFLMAGGRAMAYKNDVNFEFYMKMTSQELMTEAQKYIYNSNQPDSALLCYTIVANRYSKDMDDIEKERCINALIGEWYVYFFIHFDYNKSYDCLVKARDIAKSSHIRMADINMNFGCMYQAIAEQSKDHQLYDKAFNYFVKAIDQSVADNNQKILNISFTNLLSVAEDIDSLEKVSSIWKKYAGYKFKDEGILVDYNKEMYRALTNVREKRYDKALECYDRQISMTSGNKEYVRFLFISYTRKAGLLIKMNRTDEALGLLNTMMQITCNWDMKDARLMVYELYSKLYRNKGDYKKLEENRDRYFTLKDSLLSYRQIVAMNEVHFVNEIKNIDDKFKQLKIKNDFQVKMFYVESLFLLAIIIFAVIVILKNRQLKKTNLELYNKNVLLIKSEDQSKAMCRKYKEVNPDIEDEVPATETNVELNEEETLLLNEIIKIMDDSEMICSYNFTLEKLSALVNSKQRIVSELISKVYDCNFNSFLGTYRIKEACRRFEDTANYGNLTIEGVANSVGFKSRSNFVSTFKKFTGLTPSKYKQMSEMHLNG